MFTRPGGGGGKNCVVFETHSIAKTGKWRASDQGWPAAISEPHKYNEKCTRGESYEN